MNVFTYGTLMFPEIWQMVVGRSFGTVEGNLAGHAVLGINGEVYPGMIRRDDTSIARGLVYLQIDEASLTRLDRFEGDFYARDLVNVACTDGHTREAYAYLVRDEKRHVLTGRPWTAQEFQARGDLALFIARYGGFGRLSAE